METTGFPRYTVIGFEATQKAIRRGAKESSGIDDLTITAITISGDKKTKSGFQVTQHATRTIRDIGLITHPGAVLKEAHHLRHDPLLPCEN